jgi:hypothetical protein
MDTLAGKVCLARGFVPVGKGVLMGEVPHMRRCCLGVLQVESVLSRYMLSTA